MLRELILIIGITLTLAGLSYFGVKLVHPAPSWQEYQIEDYRLLYKEADKKARKILSMARAEKNRQFLQAKADWAKQYFYAIVPIALIIMLLSGAVQQQTVSTGFISTSLVLLITAFSQYWSDVSDVTKFISLLLALVILLLISYEKLSGLFFYDRAPELENKAYKNNKKKGKGKA